MGEELRLVTPCSPHPGLRLHTFAGGARPGSGRLASGRMRTGMQSGVPDCECSAAHHASVTPGASRVWCCAAVNYSGVGLNTQVAVAARPVTQQGMAGVRTATGRGRQVQDSSYHMGLLRKRISEITAEIRRMTAEYAQMEKDSSTHETLQRRYDTCIKEVSERGWELGGVFSCSIATPTCAGSRAGRGTGRLQFGHGQSPYQC